MMHPATKVQGNRFDKLGKKKTWTQLAPLFTTGPKEQNNVVLKAILQPMVMKNLHLHLMVYKKDKKYEPNDQRDDLSVYPPLSMD